MVMSVNYERSILFTFIATSCMRTSAQRKKPLRIYCIGHIDAPRDSRISSVDAFPSAEFVYRTTRTFIRADDAHLLSQLPCY